MLYMKSLIIHIIYSFECIGCYGFWYLYHAKQIKIVMLPRINTLIEMS